MPTGQSGKLVLNKTYIFSEDYCYIYQRGGTQSKNWQFYYWDSEGNERFRIRKSLGTPDFAKAQSLAQKEFITIKAKIQNEESLATLTIAEMAEIFLAKKKSQISPSPHSGVTQETYRVLANRCEKLAMYLGANTRVDHVKRDVFQAYEQWRLDGHGGKIPKTKTTIKTELSTFKSIFQSIAIKDKRVISNVPDIPEIKVPRSESGHRRNHFRDDELVTFLKTVDHWKEEVAIKRSTVLHKQIVACAIELMLNSGIRIGAVKKIRWRDIRKNPKDSRAQQILYRIITVPPENNKTGKEYECNCEAGLILRRLQAISAFTKPEDFLFCNQSDGKPFSSRIWADYWKQIMELSGLQANNSRRFSYYSLRHTYATTALSNKVPLQLLASNMDTSTKYIQDHYYHHEPEMLTAELNPKKKRRTMTGNDIYRTYGS